MKIISCNVNGIRSAHKKGFLEFLHKEKPDIVCLQEVKANKEDLPLDLLNIKGYYSFFNPAYKKGYSGVAVYTKEKPTLVKMNLGIKRFDSEGRILDLEYKKFILLNIYFPHGGRKKENLAYKLDVYKKILSKIKKINNKEIILIGDFNIAHNDIDLARPRQNRNNIMFTQEERNQLDAIVKSGLVDSFRSLNDKSENYTWWPYAFNAKERNMGWRIDYGFVSQKISKNLNSVAIYSEVIFSDHCPIGLTWRS